MTVRTRFAPSPTGYMHIGGMRTALFNWLWARHNDGVFVLRIDDTDSQRNMEEALPPILQAFRWLGLEWNEGPEVGGDFGPYFQSERGELYEAALQKLMASGKAYRDFYPREKERAERDAAEKEKRVFLNNRSSLDLSAEEIQKNVDDGVAHVIRFLVPRDEKVSIDDEIRGHVEWDCSLMVDPAICRGDGSPLYNFATTVDDAAMEISHVIRAEEHLSNTPIQVLIHKALGNTIPTYAHIPYVAAPGTKVKMSKRKVDKYRKNAQFRNMFDAGDRVFPQIGLDQTDGLNPVMVEYYEKIGYLPAGVLNALGRLGWSLDDKTEIFSIDDLVKHFTLDRVVKNPAGLDPEKLMSYQAHWMTQLSEDEKVAGCLPYLSSAEHVDASPTDAQMDRVRRLIAAVGDRLKIFSDILTYDEFFVADDKLEYNAKDFKKRIRKSDVAADLLTTFRGELSNAEDFSAESLDKLLHDFVETKGIGIGDVIHALRVATTGKAKGPGMFDCLALLGKKSCCARIDRALSMIDS